MTIPTTSIEGISTPVMRDGTNLASDTSLSAVAGQVLEQGEEFQAAVEQFQRAMAELDEVGVAVATSATLPLGEAASCRFTGTTDVPSVATLPEATDVPSVAVLPRTTDVPSVAALPGATDAPSVAVSPGTTDVPSVAVSPGTTDGSSVAAPSGTTDVPSVAVSPGTTDVPSVAVSPGTTDVPSIEVATGATLPLSGDDEITVDTHDHEEAETPTELQAVPIAVTPEPQAVDVQDVAVESVQVVAARVAHQVTATPAQVLIEAASAVADTIVVSPGLLRGSGEIQVQLRPDVLEGTVINISTTSPGALSVQFTPTTENMAVLLEKCAPQLVTYLSERVHSFQIAVNVKRDDKLKG